MVNFKIVVFIVIISMQDSMMPFKNETKCKVS